MSARVLKRMREMVRRGEYVMTTHADEEADADELSVYDVESAILTAPSWRVRKIRKHGSGSMRFAVRPLMAARYSS